MARYYRRRYTRVVRPKKKWASNMVIRRFAIFPQSETAANRVPFSTLVINSAATATPTPVIIKTGNFKINADLFISTSGATNTQLMALVIYIPEGFAIPDNATLGAFVTAHPEYVMAWRQFDGSATGTGETSNRQEQQITFSSRLKRNLNSGDQVAFAVLDNSGGNKVTTINISISAQYWTCAN